MSPIVADIRGHIDHTGVEVTNNIVERSDPFTYDRKTTLVKLGNNGASLVAIVQHDGYKTMLENAGWLGQKSLWRSSKTMMHLVEAVRPSPLATHLFFFTL